MKRRGALSIEAAIVLPLDGGLQLTALRDEGEIEALPKAQRGCRTPTRRPSPLFVDSSAVNRGDLLRARTPLTPLSLDAPTQYF